MYQRNSHHPIPPGVNRTFTCCFALDKNLLIFIKEQKKLWNNTDSTTTTVPQKGWEVPDDQWIACSVLPFPSAHSSWQRCPWDMSQCWPLPQGCQGRVTSLPPGDRSSSQSTSEVSSLLSPCKRRRASALGSELASFGPFQLLDRKPEEAWLADGFGEVLRP